MKKLLFALCFFSGVTLFAQNTTIRPDCVIPFAFTANASTSNATCGAPNGAPNTNGIASWIVVYYSTGFSGESVTVQSAPDNHGVPGSWGTFAGTVLTNVQYPGSSGINPNTATTSAFTGFAGYYPWMRVNVSGLTGSGKITGTLYGFYNSTLAQAGAGGGGGGGGPTITGNANRVVVAGAGCTTGSTATCNIDIPVNPIFLGVATAAGFNSVEPYSGNLQLNGFTSGNVTLTVADVAGTAIAYMWPSTNGVPGQVLSDSGVATCPTLPAGAPTVCHQLAWIAAGGGTAGGGVLGYSATALTLPTSGTTFLAPVGGALASTTESNVILNAPAAAAISNMYVTLSAAPGAGNSVAFTFRDAGSGTALTCTISTAATSCQDITHSFTPTVGDALSIQVVTSGTVVITPIIKIIAEYGVTGGGGAATGLFGSRPSCSTSGSTYYATDIPVISECNASTWADWYNGQAVSLPYLQSFTARNSATVTTNGVAYMSPPAAGVQLNGQDIPLPTPPYTLWLGLNCLGNGGDAYCGAYILDASTGACVTYAILTGQYVQSAHFSSCLSGGLGGGTQDNTNPAFGQIPNKLNYLRVVDDGTNFTFFYCTDKAAAACLQSFQESRTANLTTPAFIGWWGSTNGGNPLSAITNFDFTITHP